MNRRDFLRRSALVAAGAVAADQLDLLDRLGWTRRFFAGADFERRIPLEVTRGYAVSTIEDGGYEVITTPAIANRHGYAFTASVRSINLYADPRCPPEHVFVTSRRA